MKYYSNSAKSNSHFRHGHSYRSKAQL
jgi:hypothetical protein